jgi:hypothetical protein
MFLYLVSERLRMMERFSIVRSVVGYPSFGRRRHRFRKASVPRRRQAYGGRWEQSLPKAMLPSSVPEGRRGCGFVCEWGCGSWNFELRT